MELARRIKPSLEVVFIPIIASGSHSSGCDRISPQFAVCAYVGLLGKAVTVSILWLVANSKE